MTAVRHILRTSDDDLLDAARATILAVGFGHTTLTAIAKRAGVSRMTLYRRWPDTRSLLADLLTREWGRTVGRTMAAEPGDDGPAAIAEAVVRTVQALRRDELLARVVELDPQLLLPYLLERPGRAQDAVAELIAARVRRGQRAGVVRRGNAQRIARAVLLSCHGFTLSAGTMSRDPRALDRELRALLEGYLRR